MTWALALSNLQTIPSDTRHTCRVCGARFEAYQQSRSVYCSQHCKEIGSTERKNKQAREKRAAAKRAAYKPVAECTPAHQHKVERKRYWIEVFGCR